MKRLIGALFISALVAAPGAWADDDDRRHRRGHDKHEWKQAKHEEKEWKKHWKHARKHGDHHEHVMVNHFEPAPVMVHQPVVVHRSVVVHQPVYVQPQPVYYYPAQPGVNVTFRLPLN